ncbi:hypothetical protein MANES_04G030425v8 [Manihot esculenta]|uniref:Uncharacterized protein n=1 Tax=Manihot esculenta TaxID=3983 RepID=A0ACB7HTN2_MANES|nr:hypothetical protein MANES_04G030425v8 [Manihot esculenta]
MAVRVCALLVGFPYFAGPENSDLWCFHILSSMKGCRESYAGGVLQETLNSSEGANEMLKSPTTFTCYWRYGDYQIFAMDLALLSLLINFTFFILNKNLIKKLIELNFSKDSKQRNYDMMVKQQN